MPAREGMIRGVEVDFGRTATDYATHRAGFPSEMIDRLRQRGIGLPGQDVVDVGTGTGSLARLFARSGCQVVGIDPAEPLLEQARKLDQAAGVDVAYVVATAEETGLVGESFDVFAAGQCWHWFRRAEAAEEAKRVLRPGGWIVICHFDWLPLRRNVVEATEQLIVRHNPEWRLDGGTGLHPAWTVDVAEAGFDAIETFSFDVSVLYTHEAWRGRVRASAGVGGSLSMEAVSAFDSDLAVLLFRFAEPISVPHRVWGLTARRPE